jgi:pSer/pThr/pTyr-binding forkhead associated (FHA) protein
VSARLVWSRPGAEAVEFPLDGEPVEIGRDEDASVRIDEPLVSRRHARIERRGEAWIVVDLGSTNFTRVNGHRIRREHEIEDGDELVFGRARCVFRSAGA